MINQIDHILGFPNDDLAGQILKEGTSHLNDIQKCKLAILLAMSDREDYRKEAQKILVYLSKKYDRKSPFMLLKWVINIQDGKDRNGNLESMISDWTETYPDDVMFSRTVLWLKSKSRDPIELIGSYVKHLEVFWDDALAWSELGKLYELEGIPQRAAFCFDEAAALEEKPEYLIGAARNRINIGQDEYYNANENMAIARNQLAKAVMLDDQAAEGWDLLIENTADAEKKKKYIKYRDSVLKKAKTD